MRHNLRILYLSLLVLALQNVSLSATGDLASSTRVVNPEYPAWNTEARSMVDFPPMYYPVIDGSLKPRRVTEKDFYLNVVDVSNPYRLVIKFTEEAMLRVAKRGFYSKSGVDISQLTAFLNTHPEFSLNRECPEMPEELFDYWEANGERNTGLDLANLNNFYVLEIPTNPNPTALLLEVIAINIVETAFYMPRMDLPCADLAPPSPNFVPLQSYLDAAPLGIHANFAGVYHPGGGRGNPSAWCIDVELDWTEDHEDFPAGFEVIGGDRNEPANHGDAVIGILAACDNSYGVTGISHNVTPKAISSWVQGEDDVNPALNLAAANLFPGESYMIEHHAPGPDAGTVCDTLCGNCGQFRYIAMEYWDNTFNTVQTHVANGIIVYAAAGNGQMDLDHAVYNNRFQRWYRDSGAIIVGAARPNIRDADCVSCYGSRVDCQGWGDDIMTTGYNVTPGWSPGDIRQYYNNDFGATSGATPMVTGAGNCLQGISQMKYGITLTPAQMRDYLVTTGTPWTGTKDVGERPNLVDAINHIEPDVVPDHRIDWSGPVVPRNLNNAIPGICSVTPELDGNTTNTYLNFGIANLGRSPAPDAGTDGVETRLYIDDFNLNWTETWMPRIDALSTDYSINRGPIYVRGGRHSLIWESNPNNWFTEFDHSNNSHSAQFVWSPYQLPMNTGITRLAPPFKYWGSPVYQNGDGFRATGTWWTAVATLPQADNDIDLYCYADVYTSTSGFDLNQASSTRGTGSSDLILINGNISGYETSRLFQAVRYSDPSTDDYAIEADGSIDAWTPPVEIARAMNANDVLDVFEVYMTTGQDYFIGVVDLFGGLDLGLALYAPGSELQDFYDYAAWVDSEGSNGAEFIYYTPPVSGYYAVVAIKPGYGTYGIGGSYTFKFESPGTPDLIPAGRVGWTLPAVVRNSSDATPINCEWPTAIQGNATNYMNGTWYNGGTNASAHSFTNEVRLDEIPLTIITHSGGLGVFEYGEAINQNVGDIRGGRHTLTIDLDATNQVAESNETNNEFTWQYAWSPLTLSSDTPVPRAAPPLFGSWIWPNSDGFEFDPGANSPSGTAILSYGGSADYDLYLCSNYTGTGDGFTDYLGTSTYGSNAPDYVIVPAAHDTAFYPAVINFNAAVDSFVIEAQGASARTFASDFWYAGSEMIPESGIWKLYHFPLVAGVEYELTCTHISGAANIALRLFRDDVGVVSRAEAIAVADNFGGGQGETILYMPASSGMYTLVVEKIDAAQRTLSIEYSIGTTGPPPLNDDCPGTEIVAIPFFDSGSTTSANPDLSGCVSAVSKDVIYHLQPVGCQDLTVSLCGSGYDTGLEVREGGVVCPGQPFGHCSDDFCGQQSELSFQTFEGMDYYIIVHGYSTHHGSYSLSVTGVSCPPDTLPPPEELTIVRSGVDIILRWMAVSGATGYEVYSSSVPQVDILPGNLLGSTLTTEMTLVNQVVAADTQLFFAVIARSDLAQANSASEVLEQTDH